MEHIHLETAEAMAHYTSDMFAGQPAVTKNSYGKGCAYYIATRTDTAFNRSFYREIANRHQITKVVQEIPYGVSVTQREDAEYRYLFIMNFLNEENKLLLSDNHWINLRTAENIGRKITIEPYQVIVVKTQI